MDGFNNNQAAFLGFGLEAFAYGIYAVLFGMAVMYLTWRRRSSGTNHLLLFMACVLFVSCTIHFALEFDSLYRVLILHPNPGVDISAETPELLAADILVSLIDFFGEIVLIYRCWIVWEKNWFVIILPSIISLAGISCAMAVIGLLEAIDPTAPIAPAAIVPLGTAAFTLPLCFNFIATALIVGRIWQHGRRMRAVLATSTRTSGSSLAHVRAATGVLVESGALYLAVQLVFVVLFAIGHPAQGLVVPIAVQIYGIAPTLILVRVGLGVSTETVIARSALEYSTGDLRRTPGTLHVSVSTTRQGTFDYELGSVQNQSKQYLSSPKEELPHKSFLPNGKDEESQRTGSF